MDYRDLMNTLPSKTDLTSNKYKSQGDILKELKRIQSIDPDEINFPGIDNLELFGVTLNQAKNNFKQKRTDAINALGSKYEQFIEDGPRERFDLPPLKDGMLGIKAAGSEQGMAQAKVLRDIKSAKDKQGAKEEPYDGPFGKLGEYFAKNADKRDELFDYISSIGRQLVKPTNPGEARSFLGDISAGLESGEQRIASKDAAALDALVKRAEYAQAVDPLQNYTSKMKEVRQDALSRGLEPGTKAYNDYVGARLRGEGVSDEIKNTVDALDNLRLQKVSSPESAEQIDKQIKLLEDKLIALSTGDSGTVALGGSDNDISYLGNELTTSK
jgi:hypothetical protein